MSFSPYDGWDFITGVATGEHPTILRAETEAGVEGAVEILRSPTSRVIAGIAEIWKAPKVYRGFLRISADYLRLPVDF